jgi:hypothetical protein
MSKKKQAQKPGRPPANHQLVVWGERRKEPDWDTFIAALLSYALREVGASVPKEKRDD